MKNERKAAILIAEDDDDDYLLMKKALQDSHFPGSIYRVKDGEELTDFFLGENSKNNEEGSGIALILLLDLNMPRKDGREALKEIKSHPDLRRIPVVVLTTSHAQSDIAVSYDLGANSFIRKPESFEEFTAVTQLLLKYWFEAVELPYRCKVERLKAL